MQGREPAPTSVGLGSRSLFLHIIIFYRPSVVAVFYCNFEENRCRFIENQNKMATFAAQTNNGGQDMELQTVKTGKERLIASGASIDGISIRRTGIAKVLWRKLDVDIPKSEVIANGVNIYKG
jgi:hypothetical protein